MLAIWTIRPATRSYGKQNKTSYIKITMGGNNAEASRFNHNTLWCLTFPRSKQQTSCYNLLLGKFWADDLAVKGINIFK